MSTMATTRNAACPCGSGRRFKHCHGRMPRGDADIAGGRRLDFVVAGAQRSGTTSLDLHLRNHPGIAMPLTRKELHFFDDDARFASGEVDYDDYHAHFAPRGAGQLRGEVTPSYLYWIPAVERLARYNPLLRIVVILRNPITRAYSHWNKESQRGRESLAFLDALRAERERAVATPSGQNRRTSYADRGFYAGQLRRLWTHFPREQTLILRSEALQTECARTLGRIAEFLGVTAFPAIAPIAANIRDYERPMRVDEWDWLAGQFAADIRDIESLLGWDCRDWLRRPAASP
jgi:hypothetical protein